MKVLLFLSITLLSIGAIAEDVDFLKSCEELKTATAISYYDQFDDPRPFTSTEGNQPVEARILRCSKQSGLSETHPKEFCMRHSNRSAFHSELNANVDIHAVYIPTMKAYNGDHLRYRNFEDMKTPIGNFFKKDLIFVYSNQPPLSVSHSIYLRYDRFSKKLTFVDTNLPYENRHTVWQCEELR